MNNSHTVCTISFLGKHSYSGTYATRLNFLSKETPVNRLACVTFTASRWEANGQYLYKFTAPTTWQISTSYKRISTILGENATLPVKLCSESQVQRHLFVYFKYIKRNSNAFSFVFQTADLENTHTQYRVHLLCSVANTYGSYHC